MINVVIERDRLMLIDVEMLLGKGPLTYKRSHRQALMKLAYFISELELGRATGETISSI